MILVAITFSVPSEASTTLDEIKIASQSVVPDYIPEPQQGLARTLLPGEEVKSLTYEQWRAISRINPDRQYQLAKIAWCESRFDPNAVGDGGLSIGAWQVQPRFWGSVPDTLEEQAVQADRIAAEHGYKPWTTANGCDGWRD